MEILNEEIRVLQRCFEGIMIPRWILYVSVAYVVIVVMVRKLMERIPQFDTKKGTNGWSLCAILFLLHNVVMCLFSFLVFIGFGIAYFIDGESISLYASICSIDSWTWRKFVGWIFASSKVYELMDTLFLLIGKSEIRFIHVYHHAITLILSWVVYSVALPVSWYFGIINALVHVPMYYYYAMIVIGKTVWWKKYLTTIQIAQFGICLALMIYGFSIQYITKTCHVPHERGEFLGPYLFGFLCYATFMVLFVQLFLDTYGVRSSVALKKDR